VRERATALDQVSISRIASKMKQICCQAESELVLKLTNDGHQIERITPERWKAITALLREPDEIQKSFEHLLDTNLLAVIRCSGCGRSFLLIELDKQTFFVADEEGDRIEIDTEPPCLARARTAQ